MVNALKRSGGVQSIELIETFFKGWDETHKEDPSILEKKILEQIRVWIEEGISIKPKGGENLGPSTTNDMKTKAWYLREAIQNSTKQGKIVDGLWIRSTPSRFVVNYICFTMGYHLRGKGKAEHRIYDDWEWV